MTTLTGILLACGAAVAHTAIDSTRKYAGSVVGIPSDGLVTVPAILDAVISCAGVALTGRWERDIKHPTIFMTATLASSLLLLVSRYMYQRAIQLSPLSLTIPYLAFTPAILIVTAYVFLGELPGPSGLLGVSVVALGGYLLNLRAGSAPGPAAGAAGGGAVAAASGGNNKSSGGGGNSAHALASASAGPQGPTAGPAAALVAAARSLMQRSSSSSTVSDVESSSAAVLSGQWGQAPGLGLGPGPAGGAKRAMKVALQRRVSSAVDLLRSSQAAWQQEPGTVLIMGVAIIWSVTASLDKLGVITAPSIWVYFASQRLAIGVASLGYILAVSPRLLLLLRDHFWILLAVSAMELAAVVFFLLAVRHLLVSYVVAIKRCNVLFSTLLGAMVFRESVRSRLPYIFLMMLGMMLIVLEPGAHSFVQSHT